MKLMTLAALVVAPLVARAAEPFLTYPEAIAAAKAKGQDVILLVDGAGTPPDAAGVSVALSSQNARKPIGDAVIWGRFQCEIHTEKDYKPDKSKEPESKPWNLPALMLIDPDGKVFANVEGLRPGGVPAVLSKIPPVLAARKQRDELWAKARAASGPQRATLFGDGLDLMAPACAAQRKDIIKEISNADPKDESGYVLKYTFNTTDFHEKTVDKMIADKKTDELIATIDRDLTNKRITPRQRQVILTGKFQALRATEKLPEALTVLKQIIAVAPSSDMGIGAAGYLKDLTEPVQLTGRYWTPQDNRPLWLPMIADVSDVVKTPGTYEIEFKHKAGHTRFAKTEFFAGTKTLASDPNKDEAKKIRLTVTEIPKGAKVMLRADSRGTGWFEGAGEILVSKAE